MAMSELDQYDYELPEGLIAQYPLPDRSAARLMIVDRSSAQLAHHHVSDLPDLLHPDDCLVINDSKVIPARLLGYRRQTGGRWEGLFVDRDPRGIWRVLGKTRGKLTAGERVVLINAQGRDDIELEFLARLPDKAWAVRACSGEDPFAILDRVGRVPLPPYIRKGEMRPEDRQTYQTIYARDPGSVAAPTAGLHFTEGLFHRLIDRGIAICRVTLHVGLGTFHPIKVESLDQHVMHKEWAHLRAEAVETIESRRRAGGRVVAVGTTSMRVLETAAGDGELRPFSGETDLFIRPPFSFHAVDALMTNFHLPRSTLLVLVRTFGGDALMRRAYEEAVSERYRFFSYGDAMLIL